MHMNSRVFALKRRRSSVWQRWLICPDLGVYNFLLKNILKSSVSVVLLELWKAESSKTSNEGNSSGVLKLDISFSYLLYRYSKSFGYKGLQFARRRNLERKEGQKLRKTLKFLESWHDWMRGTISTESVVYCRVQRTDLVLIWEKPYRQIIMSTTNSLLCTTRKFTKQYLAMHSMYRSMLHNLFYDYIFYTFKSQLLVFQA
jgi:hypothetical protein